MAYQRGAGGVYDCNEMASYDVVSMPSPTLTCGLTSGSCSR